MALIFIGRPGVEKYKDGEEYKQRASQQFKSGVMIVKEQVKGKQTFYEDVLGVDGKPQIDEKGGKVVKAVEKEGVYEKTYSFKVKDIGQKFEFANEADVLKRYPVSFKK